VTKKEANGTGKLHETEPQLLLTLGQDFGSALIIIAVLVSKLLID
jgi:hypothetical protein